MGSTPTVRTPLRPAKKGEAPTIEWARWVEGTLRRLMDQSTGRMRPVMGRGGLDAQFRVTVRKDGEIYKARVLPGYVRNVRPSTASDPVIKDWMPTLGGTPIDEQAGDPLAWPEVNVAHGQTVYCRVETDEKEIITVAPTIVAETTDETGVHSQRDSINGDYYHPIADIDITDGVVTITQIQQGGPILIRPNLIKVENIGGEREMYHEYDKATLIHKMRTLQQLEGGGVAILKPLDPGDPLAEPPVAAEEEGDTLKIRDILKDNSAGTPYTITAPGDGDTIKVKFTGTTSTVNIPGGAVLELVDGLGSSYVPGATVKNLNLSIYGCEIFNYDAGAYCMINPPFAGPPEEILYWRGGVYVGKVAPDDPVGLVVEESSAWRFFESS